MKQFKDKQPNCLHTCILHRCENHISFFRQLCNKVYTKCNPLSICWPSICHFENVNKTMWLPQMWVHKILGALSLISKAYITYVAFNFISILPHILISMSCYLCFVYLLIFQFAQIILTRFLAIITPCDILLWYYVLLTQHPWLHFL